MIIIGFCRKTSKILPRLLCRDMRHCAPIIPTRDGYILYQFVKHGQIYKIKLRKNDLARLQHFGWRFIMVRRRAHLATIHRAITCVALVKRVINLRAPLIQTPDQLMRALVRRGGKIIYLRCGE